MHILVQVNVKTKHDQLQKFVRKTQETCSNLQKKLSIQNNSI
jgi:hypothetical protein